MDRTDAKVLTFLTLCLALSIAGLKFQIPLQEYIQQAWIEYRKYYNYDISGPLETLRKIIITLENLKTYPHIESTWGRVAAVVFGFDSLNPAAARLHFPVFKAF